MLLSFCLIFCHFQPGVAYKNVAYTYISLFAEKESMIKPLIKHVESLVHC